MFLKLHSDFDEVFQPAIGRYNDYSGKVRARVNIGETKPPTKKLHTPNYSKSNLEELQDKFDELESQGVFVRPEDVGVNVEHVSTSFLIRKPNSTGTRLVTAFTSIGEYCKVLPTSLPTVDETIRTIASWKYIIKTDLRDSFYQIPLEHSSMKWCATQTPFRGLRCYAVSAQGMPGSSETLEEVMCAVLGNLVHERRVAKVTDDLYVGSSISIDDLLDNWHLILIAMRQNGLKLKSSKTSVAPTETQILGWNWNQGRLSACSHKITPLATCEPPPTATAMRSFVGAYKVFNRVIKGCSRYLADLESAISGKQKSDKIDWSDTLRESFRKAQDALKSPASILVPRPSDQLIITHDGSNVGIGSVLFIKRDEELHLGGFFSAKLKSHHSKWCPCELEALSIATSIQHFAPYIRESTHSTQVLTDNKPCVQAWHKMRRGEFSTSARIATFLATLSQYRVDFHLISGSMNLPSDFHSRNPQVCDSHCCQVCKFIDECDDAAVRSVTVEEILSGHSDVPYSNRSAWKSLQLECSDLCKVHAHLSKGTRPSPKRTNQTSVKRYLNEVMISKDGLLVIMHTEPYYPKRELIVVPKHVLYGLLTSIHLKLNHPTVHQLQKVFSRGFHAQNSTKAIQSVIDNCHTCQSLKSIPKELHQQSSTDFPVAPCKSYASDVVKRYGQLIFIIRDTFSSFTIANLIHNETSSTLKESLISAISMLRPSPQTAVTVRVDNAPGFKALRNDFDLSTMYITLDYGRVHNKNKNPVVDKGIRKVISEILRLNPEGGRITTTSLAHAVNQLNSRIRNRGLSAWEILTKRDQDNMKPLDVDDSTLSAAQADIRSRNQLSSAKNKAQGGPEASRCFVLTGCLVYLKADGDKTRSRERYIVTNVSGDSCTIQKLDKSLRNTKYDIKITEIYPVTSTINIRDDCLKGLDQRDDDEEESEIDDSQVSYPETEAIVLQQSASATSPVDILHPTSEHCLPEVLAEPDPHSTIPELADSVDSTNNVEVIVDSVDTDTTTPSRQEAESPPVPRLTAMKLRSPSKRQKPRRFDDYECR